VVAITRDSAHVSIDALGSHGIQAHACPAVLAMIQASKLRPQQLIGKTIRLEQAPQELAAMNSFTSRGVTVINGF